MADRLLTAKYLQKGFSCDPNSRTGFVEVSAESTYFNNQICLAPELKSTRQKS